jgi:D-lactate dehydrogenase
MGNLLQRSNKLIDRLARNSDAAFYQALPDAVVFPQNGEDISVLFTEARGNNSPLFFRAGATSLSGQATNRGLCVDISRGFTTCEIREDGREVVLGPGLSLATVNALLHPYGRQLGPDPASSKACRIGGVVANNASGITSGTTRNAYRTMLGMRFILPSGTRIDTKAGNADKVLQQQESHLYDELLRMRDTVRQNAQSRRHIERMFSFKNTVGYGLNSFLDFDEPVNILAHLLIGSEGTLGFIEEITLQTFPLAEHIATGLIGFRGLGEAAAAVDVFRQLNADAIEIMSSSALDIIRQLPDLSRIINSLSDAKAALLVEYRREQQAELEECLEATRQKLAAYDNAMGSGFASDRAERARLWRARKSLFATVGGQRQPRTTVITEDVVVPHDKLVETIQFIEALLLRYGFANNSVVFGHAKDGSLHFNFAVDFANPRQHLSFHALSDELAEFIIVEVQGVLKGEHGTGRAIREYVEKQWGSALYQQMQKLKKLIDPNDICNPGIVLPSGRKEFDEVGHKATVPVAAEIDKCVECGFCETSCPSAELTLTPRQRIVVWRAIHSGLAEADRQEVLRDYAYAGEATCAVDGLCQVHCPVDINTGTFISALRRQKHGRLSAKIASLVAGRYGSFLALARFSLAVVESSAHLFGSQRINHLMQQLNRRYRLPVRHSFFPRRRRQALPKGQQGGAFIYFPGCLHRLFSGDKADRDVISTMLTIAAHVNIDMVLPDGLADQCCGLTFFSKGYEQAGRKKAAALVAYLFTVSKGGQMPIVVDISPCTHQILKYAEYLQGQALQQWRQLRIIDAITFLHREVVAHIKRPLTVPVHVHPVCSVQKMNLVQPLYDIASVCTTAFTPAPIIGCCGSAGDRGWRYPELTESATKAEAAWMREHPAAAGYSSSRTCEAAMSQATGTEYRHIVFLVAAALGLDQPEL